MIKQYNKTIQFYGFSLMIPWLFWTIAAIISHLPNHSNSLSVLQGIFGIMGLVTPMLVAAYFFFSNRELYNDLKQRLFIVKNAKPIVSLRPRASFLADQMLATCFEKRHDQTGKEPENV